MQQNVIEARLSGLNLGEIRFFQRLGSTNDAAAAWAEAGAADLALVVADEQIAGRGRDGRKWISPPSSGLAFSIVLRPAERQPGDHLLPRLTALGALAVLDALKSDYGLPVQIKWPNDVLVERKKVAGVLAEAQWAGSTLAFVILGIGVNVTPASAGEAARLAAPLRFPATSLESALGRPVDRLELLESILQKLLKWRTRLSSAEFLHAWEKNLAFRGEWIQITPWESRKKDGSSSDSLESIPPLEAQIVDLAPDGGLRLRTRSGELVTVRFGDVRLLPSIEKEVGYVR